MKNKFLPLFIGALGIASLSACNGKIGVFPGGKFVEEEFKGQPETEVEYFALNKVLVNFNAGESKKLDIESLPGSYSASNLVFKSSDESVATVDTKGNVKAVKKGISDVSVSAKDGTFLGKVRVVVSSKSNVTGCKTAINNIKSVYNAASYEAPTRTIRYEYSYERYLCEGVIDHGMDSFEVMGYDSVTGYFFVEGPTLYKKTPHGAPEVADGKWIFYPIIEGAFTRMIHITPKGKTFYDINTAGYSSYDKAIRDIINFFFVSGEQILTNLLEDYDGKEDFTSATNPDDPYVLYNVDDNSLVAEVTESNDGQVVSADDELNYMDIPADTEYSYDYIQTFLNDSGRTSAQEIAIDMYYNRDGNKWTRSFYRSQLFEDFPEEEQVIYEDPADNGFTEVDSLYDL